MRLRYILLGLTLIAAAALAHEHGEHAEWYRALRVPDTGTSCCNNRDCIPTDFRLHDGIYEIPVGFVWIRVPPGAVIKDRGNPVGRAVVCRHGETIFCFVPLFEGT